MLITIFYVSFWHCTYTSRVPYLPGFALASRGAHLRRQSTRACLALSVRTFSLLQNTTIGENNPFYFKQSSAWLSHIVHRRTLITFSCLAKSVQTPSFNLSRKITCALPCIVHPCVEKQDASSDEGRKVVMLSPLIKS